MKIETYLPLFSGFYGTFFEPDYSDYLNEKGLTDEDIEFNNTDYELDVVKYFAYFVEQNIPFVKSVKVQNIVSPKYYNFSNDSVNVEIDLNTKELKAYIKANALELNKYLKENYTSCSGFISRYPNSFEGWKEATNNWTKLENHYLGSLLNFYLQNEGIFELSAYYYVEENIYIGEYITELTKEVKELYYDDKVKICIDNFDKLEVFGYTELLMNQYKTMAKKLGLDFVQYFCEKETDYILKTLS
jgi:hypothetical protein